MTKFALKEMVAAAKATYDAMTPSDKLRHDYAQRRSFARGMCPDKRDYVEWCLEIEKRYPDEANLSDAEIGLILMGLR